MSEAISVSVDAEGIAELRWDDPARKVNVFSAAEIAEFAAIVTRIRDDNAIRGVLITSGKGSFHAGADLNMVSGFFDMSAADLWEIMSLVMTSFYRLETCGKPVVAALNGHCLGGGFEMALAAHARFVADDPRIRIGLPEAGLGLMPGFGGTQRMARIAPWKQAAEDIMEGRCHDPQTALSLGLVGGVVPADGLEAAARDWLWCTCEAKQPWAVRGYRPPGAAADFEQYFTALNAALIRDGAADRPERRLIAETLYHGLQLPIEPALRHEVRCFIELAGMPDVRSTMRQRFFGEAA
ncbi:enoyl-CoA hydratase/isomerase family protein [Paracoccus aestuarii]|uniref:Enoyl-CoA hydratase/isomerase family protein n=1 Tax=Paracoccus aestuarii TaxID=453842 RepID=A0A418ZYD0_9RHOB|nr:enoyl-CoA hydratase/isomerase family protein [Paracoccus aestuarii]RJL05523.1 enoyl-CoA hydratase/isomerase family protein [Paracoccus aestuarii]WCQ98610.1 enoyl-CoA hydratase/isomerase family protein [Paracoccus aestuarii]